MAAVKRTNAKWTHAEWITHTDKAGIGHNSQAVSPLQPAHSISYLLNQAFPGSRGYKISDSLGVSRGIENEALVLKLLTQTFGVYKVAVVAYSDFP